MLLSDMSILEAMGNHDLDITPWNPEMLQPASVDVRLDRFYRFFSEDYNTILPDQEQPYLTELTSVPANGKIVMGPGEFLLASTYERVTISPKLSARFEGKSSLGRIGLLTHITAGFIDPGFSGHITLELHNVSGKTVKLPVGMKIGQLCFMPVTGEVRNPYGSTGAGSHYQGQRGPTASRSYINFHRTDVGE